MAVDRQTLSVGQGHGIGNLATFGDGGLVGGEGRNHLADGVGDLHRSVTAQLQVLEGLAVDGSIGDTDGQGVTVFEDVITLGFRLVLGFGLTGWNNDFVAVRQGDGQVVVELLADLDGEGRLLVFGDIAFADDSNGDLSPWLSVPGVPVPGSSVTDVFTSS
ncbi:hypothetical protein MXB02_25680 [Pseudomonas mosselii]|nr:hypothetical protein [Pseudomonas mosselii]UPF03904.1 hypothetical protein MXB02_25680 [Pseudomonas mosselii]